MLLRHQLADGFSDDVLRTLTDAGRLSATRVIVLLAAGTPSAIEARQVLIGADCVQRDPIRIDVLFSYIERYLQAPQPGKASAPCEISFAGAKLSTLDRLLRHADSTVTLTPREAKLVELLTGAEDCVVTYETLYTEILGRSFGGDTSNMRVLLGKLGVSAGKVGISIRDCVDVIAKSGYRYHAVRAETIRPSPRKPSRKAQSASHRA